MTEIKQTDAVYIEYTGEYGTELGVFVPFINYLKVNNLLGNKKVVTYSGMRPYYFFLDDSEIYFKDVKRQYISANFRKFLPKHISDDDIVFSKNIIPELYLPPDYYSYFLKNTDLQSDKPILLFQNKYNSEWGGPAKNYFSIELIIQIVMVLQDRVNIIYIRSNDYKEKGYSCDQDEEVNMLFPDKLVLKTYFPNVILFENLIEKTNQPFNVLKCIVQSRAKYTLSTIGGFNYFNAFFPSKHYIYKQWVPEKYTEDFYNNQHNLLCPHNKHDTIYYTDNKSNLLREMFLLERKPEELKRIKAEIKDFKF